MHDNVEGRGLARAGSAVTAQLIMADYRLRTNWTPSEKAKVIFQRWGPNVSKDTLSKSLVIKFALGAPYARLTINYV